MDFFSQHIFSREILLEHPCITRQDFDCQVRILRKKQQEFSLLSVSERSNLLLQFAESLEHSRELLSRQICEEVGRCLRECEAEIDKSISLVRYYAQLSEQLLADQVVQTQASLSKICFEPLGVLLAVMPWNYPVWQILRFAIPALCAGNACLIKPAPSVARITLSLFSLIDEKLPFQVAWLNHEDVPYAIASCDAFAFTGSTETGKILASYAGKHLKKCVMELGGSNPFIVLNDADIVMAAKDACYSRFRDAGQSCNAAKRFIVMDSIADKFLEELLSGVQKLKTGNPLLEETTLAPLHRIDLRDKLHQQVIDAVSNGAVCVVGGAIDDEQSSFYPATVLDFVNKQCRVYHEEVFGPVACIFRVRNIEEAVELANDSTFGLGASIYTKNIQVAWEVAKKIQSGSVFINRHTSSDLHMPFGGIKDSGFGRELSEYGIYEFVNIKSYWQK